MNVAYLGPKGTFSEEAAIRYFNEDNIEPIMFSTIFDVLEAVDEGKVDKGIVPIENAIEGTITMTTDGLLQHQLWIDGEVVLPVKLHLLTNHGAKLEEIQEVWSIPPALAQCRIFTKKLGAVTKQHSSTAGAAEALRNSGRLDAGAVASEWAAKTFGLDICAGDIHDNDCNSTRFVIVTKKPNQEFHDGDKSMLLITPTEDRPGLLAIILNVFSSLGINLTWIESRPTKKKMGTYRFFIETAKGTSRANLEKAITILETYGYDIRLLGSYKTKQL
ncbi:prephenate dehydratase [Bacillus niameyensis]|uniref:prephenate dehydratase n=1 Tax=Bacillus niameyensis TaxID=1522308 RepID=UPI000785B83F|nr:prephenate dehydratase [Bacillus niameyensis]